ncbi:hypothetical protein CYMTET_3675 [Cymbomonas tetramitiformis]|uniref:Uncharacterized protein n=1 Tax=Cymbomonas tetramitiformis TaxID=36881 RepID=A0AAE0H2Z1_9CHLO|nr:hypothetical protein CYMTET_3675 [Cymbomonas tetramitiformis]
MSHTRRVAERGNSRPRGRLRDGADNNDGVFAVSRHVDDLFDLLSMEMPQREDGTPEPIGDYFEEWPVSNLANTVGRYCVVDGGYIGRVVKVNSHRRTVRVDFGCFLHYTSEHNFEYNVRGYGERVAHTRLMIRTDVFHRVWNQNNPERREELRWIHHTASNNIFIGARCSRYNAYRHLHFRYLFIRRRGLLPDNLGQFAVNTRWLVAFSVMDSLHARRSELGLSTASGMRRDLTENEEPDLCERWQGDGSDYQPRIWGPATRCAPLISVSKEQAAERMTASMEAAKRTLAPEVEGMIVNDARARLAISRDSATRREHMDSQGLYAGCFPAVCTFGWSAVRVGRSSLKQFRAFRRPPALDFFTAKRSDADGQPRVDLAVRDELLLYSMHVARVAPPPNEVGDVLDPEEEEARLARLVRNNQRGNNIEHRGGVPRGPNPDAQVGEYAFFTQDVLETHVTDALNGRNGPSDFIQRNTRGVRGAIRSALYTWAGARAHEMAMIRSLLPNTERSNNALLQAARDRYADTIVTGLDRSRFCLPHFSSQFWTSPTGVWNVLGQFFRDAFPPIPRRLVVGTPPPLPGRGRNADDQETRAEGTLESLCHVFAANTMGALEGFMRDHGHRLFQDELRNAPRTNPGFVRWSFIGTEYPVYNPYATFHATRHHFGPPLFYETRADAIIHAAWQPSSAERVSTGRIVMVEYKMLMEATKATPRIIDMHNMRQCLTNAFMYYACVGILPSHCLIVYSTRRTDYEDRPLRRCPAQLASNDYGRQMDNVAYIALLRVDLTVRYQMRLFQRVLTTPVKTGYVSNYMDEQHFLFHPETISLQGNRPVDYNNIFQFGVPHMDMPEMFCMDNVRRPEFAITRMCVVLHEAHRRMWHPQGEQFADEDDSSVRGARFSSSSRAIDEALNDLRARADVDVEWRHVDSVMIGPANGHVATGTDVRNADISVSLEDINKDIAIRYNLMHENAQGENTFGRIARLDMMRQPRRARRNRGLRVRGDGDDDDRLNFGFFLEPRQIDEDTVRRNLANLMSTAQTRRPVSPSERRVTEAHGPLLLYTYLKRTCVDTTEMSSALTEARTPRRIARSMSLWPTYGDIC